MNVAIEQAEIAYSKGDVPIGAVIVKNNEIVSKSYNMKNILGVSVFHAEILAIIDACNSLNTWYLNDCELYVTLKPCDMCMNAIAESRISKVFYLIDSNYSDNLASNYNNIIINKLSFKNNYSELLSNFFSNLR